MTFDPKEARALVERLTFEAVNGEIDKRFAGELGTALTAALAEIERLKNPPEEYCARCGHPKSNHPYRHPFVGPAKGDGQ